jgi:hypothetical protein
MKNFGFAAALTLGVVFYSFFVTQGSFHTRAQVKGESGLDQGIDECSAAPSFPKVCLRDVVVSNTDRDLKNTDKFFNSEPGIAVDPSDGNKIVVSAFSGAWSPLENGRFQNAPLWYSRNGGQLWTKEFTIPAPPGVPTGVFSKSPCDETFDYGSDGVLYGTFLLSGSGEEGENCSSGDTDAHNEMVGVVFTGATADPADAQAWQWLLVDGKTQPTNSHAPDQPWVIVGRGPDRAAQENVYVAYQSSPGMQVAVAKAKAPPDFMIDNSSGRSNEFGSNPGLRVAADHRSGAVYSLYQTAASIQCLRASPVRYMLNRSLDGGKSWKLNGSADGIQVAQACSHQDLFTYLFGEPKPGDILGGVNSLRGGIGALAVDPSSGDVYVVYGRFDEEVGRDRIGIVRVADRGDGSMEPGLAHFVSGPEHQSALPAVAVTENGAVGVLYDTADRLDKETSRPFFSVHLAVSGDHGANFHTVVLQEFLFPENAPRGNAGPRPLGDYQQLKSLGNTFYGVFSGDGQPFGRPFHKIDPIFVKVSVVGPSASTQVHVERAPAD